MAEVEDGPPRTRGAVGVKYLVWSNEHQAWWRSGNRGYTRYIEEAGRYSEAAANAIVADATLEHGLYNSHVDPVTLRLYRCYTEWAVPAPEGLT